MIISTFKAVGVGTKDRTKWISFLQKLHLTVFSYKYKDKNKNGMKAISGKLTSTRIRNCDLHCK